MIDIRSLNFITIILIILNGIGFYINYQANGDALLTGTVSSEALLEVGGMNGDSSPISWITMMFQHGSLMHIIGNMLALMSIGVIIYNIYNPLGYIIGYFVSGIGSAIAIAIFNPNVITVGASGAICGLFGMALVGGLFSERRDEISLSAIITSIVALMITTFTVPNVSIPGHISGLIIGCIIGIILLFAGFIFKLIGRGISRLFSRQSY